MKSLPYTSLILGLVVGGCGTSSTQVAGGTSSETQSSLQLLADNSTWMKSFPSMGGSGRAAARAATELLDAFYHCIEDSSADYYGRDYISRTWRGKSVDRNGNLSCSGPYWAYPIRSTQIDLSGIFRYEGTLIQEYSNVDSTYSVHDSGTYDWTLPSGLRLELDKAIDGQWDVHFGAGCSFPLGRNAPITCNGEKAGTFVWTPDSSPTILGLDSIALTPHPTSRIPTPYDSVGVWVTDVSSDGYTTSGQLHWNLLPGDSISTTGPWATLASTSILSVQGHQALFQATSSTVGFISRSIFLQALLPKP
jgi:hypothetical protein